MANFNATLAIMFAMLASSQVVAEMQSDKHLATTKSEMDKKKRDIHAHDMLVKAEERELTEDLRSVHSCCCLHGKCPTEFKGIPVGDLLMLVNPDLDRGTVYWKNTDMCCAMKLRACGKSTLFNIKVSKDHCNALTWQELMMNG